MEEVGMTAQLAAPSPRDATTLAVTCAARVGDLFWFPNKHPRVPEDTGANLIRPWKVVWVGARPDLYIEIAFDRPLPWALPAGEPIDWLGRIGAAERVRAAA
jgi:hypothetical protein